MATLWSTWEDKTLQQNQVYGPPLPFPADVWWKEAVPGVGAAVSYLEKIILKHSDRPEKPASNIPLY